MQEYDYSAMNRADISELQGLLNRQQSAFERRLYRDDRDLGYYKYPYDLMSDPSMQSMMCIEVWDNNPASLDTKRKAFENLAVKLFGKTKAAAAKAQADAPAGKKNDLMGIVDAAAGAASEAANLFVGTLSQAALGGNLDAEGKGRDSYTEEQTGVGGGTSQVLQRIYLYMPTGLEVGYGIEYEDASMSSLDTLKLPKALASGDVNAARDLGKKLAFANLKVLDKLGELVGAESGTFSKFASAQQRQVVNPMSLHLFKEVKRREFTFAYTFLPRNRMEMNTVYEIIGLLKFFAHPKRSEGNGRFLDYPAEFSITFLNRNNQENVYLPKILKCSLQGIKVKYGDDAAFSTFAPDDVNDNMSMGAPTKITMELSFSELEILTRDRFDWKLGMVPAP